MTDKVINLANFRPYQARRPAHRRWSESWICGRCSSNAWSLSSDGAVRCSVCNTKAWNLAIHERNEDEEVQR